MFGLFKKQTKLQKAVESLQLEQIAKLRARLGDIEASHYEGAEFRHDLWDLSNASDADASLRSDVRKALRERYRYEAANNPVVSRISKVYVDDLTGESGPQLQLKSGNVVIDRHIQNRWSDWWRVSKMPNKLHVLANAVNGDGEAVAVKDTNPKCLKRVPVTLSLRLFECDRLASPLIDDLRTNYVDGVHLDESSEPVQYDILKAHPGNRYLDGLGGIYEANTFDADEVFHIYRQLRAEQHRGGTPWAPALPTMGELRKFLTATRKAAEIAASLAVMLETNLETAQAKDMITLPNGSGNMFTLPDAWKASQVKSEHPSTTLEMFFKVTVSLGAGCFSMPVDRAMGWTIQGGYAAVRSLLLPYAKRIQSDRCQVWEPLFFDPLYEEFLDELLLSDPQLHGIELSSLNLHNTKWQWAKPDLVVDPSRDATANAKRLASGEISREELLGVRDIDEHDTKAAIQTGFVDEDGNGDIHRYRRWIARNVGNKVLDESDENSSVIDDTFNLVEVA